MSHTLKDRPQPRKDIDESLSRKERPNRTKVRMKIQKIDLNDWEDVVDDFETFEKM